MPLVLDWMKKKARPGTIDAPLSEGMANDIASRATAATIAEVATEREEKANDIAFMATAAAIAEMSTENNVKKVSWAAAVIDEVAIENNVKTVDYVPSRSVAAAIAEVGRRLWIVWCGELTGDFSCDSSAISTSTYDYSVYSSTSAHDSTSRCDNSTHDNFSGTSTGQTGSVSRDEDAVLEKDMVQGRGRRYEF
jgi:hypothetical protein